MTTELIEIKEPKTRLARRLPERFHSTPDEAASLYLDDLYISHEFPHVVFQRSLLGRHATMRETRLMVWELVQLTRAFDGDARAVAAHLQIDASLVEEALRFAKHYPHAVEEAIRRSESFTLERMKSTFPDLEIFESQPAKEPE